MTIYYQDQGITLYLGNCLELTQWTAADVLITDPPYGMSYKSGRRKDQLAIEGDHSIDLRDQALELWGSKRGLVFGTWKAPRPATTRQLITWDKRGGTGFSGDLAMPWADVTEEIYVLGKGWTGPRRPALYSIPTLPSTRRPDHPTPKPVALMEQLMDYTHHTEVIADPFAGSGSTLIAARNLGRTAIGVEIHEPYAELIATRLSQAAFIFQGAS
jgi:site-specific DNA-methyltransferase (adenine-specific)